ncbi:MAG: aminoacyl-tRNA hydrolase [Flavobacteriaceae bacterium]|jgi:peptidyl-tRNA hydrolase, PTH1 family|nr:aminoacyl-tRNA hydrolase [Flavobacteriaceae bacterium]
MTGFFKWFKRDSKAIENNKFLIVGLGNIGAKYEKTRHNIGFRIIDLLSSEKNITLEKLKLGQLGVLNYSGKKIFLLKPSTLMNLSGKSVRYWMKKKNIEITNILILTDDLNLDFGKIKLKRRGSAGGHNGLKDIEHCLNTSEYPRLRFGIGNKKHTNDKVDFVLGNFSKDEEEKISKSFKVCTEVVLSFIRNGIENTMNLYN